MKNKVVFRLLYGHEIDLRVMKVNEKCVLILGYKDARCDQDILDESFGPFNWKKEYQLIDGQLFCIISIRDPETGEWVSKSDCGEYTDRTLNKIAKDKTINPSLIANEPKARASDAQKRAAFVWGIGRELYTLPEIKIWANNGDVKIVSQGNGYTTYDKFAVGEIEYNDRREVSYITVVNVTQDNKVVFKWGTKAPGKTDEQKRQELKDYADENEIPIKYIEELYKRPFDKIPAKGLDNALANLDKIKAKFQELMKHMDEVSVPAKSTGFDLEEMRRNAVEVVA